MKSSALLAALITLFIGHASGCGCETKTSLDARDWNDAGIILQATIVSTDHGALEIDIIEVYKGSLENAEETTMTAHYPENAGHAFVHNMEAAAAGQQWLFFLQADGDGLTLLDSRLPGVCALSRQIKDPVDDAALKFISKMQNVESGLIELKDENGKVWAKGAYNRSMPFGKWTYFDESGNKQESGRYLSGKRNGTWESYRTDAAGKVVVGTIDKYALGRLYCHEVYYIDGKLKMREEYSDTENKIDFYNSNGVIKKTVYTVPDNSSEVLVLYSEDGIIQEVSVMANGELVRKTMYDDSGAITGAR